MGQHHRGTPARHVDREAFGDPADLEAAGLPEIPNLMVAEGRLLAADQLLADLVEDYAGLCALEAEARANWEEHRDRILVMLGNSGDASSADKRLARAKCSPGTDGVMGEDKYRHYLTTRAAAESCGKRIGAVQSQLSALQTLIRGLRQVTGFDG